MYVIFLHFENIRIIVRGIKDENSYHSPPADGWEWIGEVEGFLDTMAFLQTQVVAYGWRNFTVEFQDVHRG